MTGNNTYSGGTTMAGGILRAGADMNLGAPTGPLLFEGGTLQLAASFDLAATRPVTLATGGGTIDTNGFQSTWGQGITGPGALTKAGAGPLTFTGENTYSGGTTVSGGTLQLGNGGTSGSILGDVADNGTLAFDRSDVVTFPGVISGSGDVAQIGSGTTILTAVSPYSGGTSVDAGTLVVGDSLHPVAALSGGGPILVAPGATLGGYGSVTGESAASLTTALLSKSPFIVKAPIAEDPNPGVPLPAATVPLLVTYRGGPLESRGRGPDPGHRLYRSDRSAGYNQRLSERRANAVAAVLEHLGIPRNEMAVAGRGMNDPRVPTPLGVREPQNRRVEIVSV